MGAERIKELAHPGGAVPGAMKRRKGLREPRSIGAAAHAGLCADVPWPVNNNVLWRTEPLGKNQRASPEDVPKT